RVYTYLEGMGWASWNLFVSVSAFVLALGFALTLFNLLYSRRHGVRALDNPWNGDSLEWVTASPPEGCNFHELPVVQGRWALWAEQKSGERRVVNGLRDDRREALVTSVLDAEPQAVMLTAVPTPWPFF